MEAATKRLYPSIADDILGWLEPQEGWLLHDLAMKVPKDGVIVEIGSFLGNLRFAWVKVR